MRPPWRGPASRSPMPTATASGTAAGSPHRGELHEERVVLELAPGQLLREARLPGAPGPDDRHQPVGRHQATEGREVVLPPDEAAEAHRDVGPAAGRSAPVASGGRSRLGILAEDGGLERLQLRARVEARAPRRAPRGRAGRRAAPPPAGRRGRGRASGSRGAARGAAPPPPAAPARATSSASRPSRRSASMRSSSAAHRSSSSRVASRRSIPSSSDPSSGGPRQSAERAAAAPRPPPSTSPATSASRPRAAAASKHRASISSSATSSRYPPAAVVERVAQRAEGPPQLRDERLQGVGAAGRQVVAPELVGQALGLDRLACPDEQEQEQHALLGAPDGHDRRRHRRTWSSPSIRNGTTGRYARPAGVWGPAGPLPGSASDQGAVSAGAHGGGMTTTATATRVRTSSRARPSTATPASAVPAGCVLLRADDLPVGDVLQHAPGTFDLVTSIDPVPGRDDPTGARPPHAAQRADGRLLLLDRRARPPHRPQGRGDTVRRPRHLASIREAVAGRRRRSAAGVSSAGRSRNGRER